MNECVTWVLIVRHLWQDMTWLCDMSTEYQSFVLCHGMTVWHEFWISHFCDMKRQCENIQNIRHLLHDMTVWHEYWITSFVKWHDCVLWVLIIRHLWHDFAWLCFMNTEYQIFVSLHDCVTWILNIRHLWNDMTVWLVYWISDICDITCRFDMSTEYQIFVT